MKKLSLVAVLFASLSVLTGCDPKGAFIGLYQANGSRVISGQHVPTQTFQIAETFEIRDGEDDEILLPLSLGDGFSCLVPMKVEGDVAYLKGNSSCTLKTKDTGDATVTFTAATASLMGGAVSLSYSASVLTTLDPSDHSVATVFLQGNATLTPLGK